MNTQLSPLAQRMLGIIYVGTQKCFYIASWDICDTFGVDRGQLHCNIPGTEYDEALKELINADLVEELPNLGLRYQLKKGQ